MVRLSVVHRLSLLIVAAALCCAPTAQAGWQSGLFGLDGQSLRNPLAPTSSSPHPSVARIIVPERDGTAFGSGTLVDCREGYGLVLTNWHVVRDATGPIDVVFPDGFRSLARAIKLDSDWDLAALVIWQPHCQPVPLATRPPQAGDVLTIAGYGRGEYRAITGRCTQYYAPRADLPKDLVELDVEARLGDSGGPMFNDRGELAGVLFGAGQGTTLGSFEGRVKQFLASVAPNIGSPASPTQLAAAPPVVEPPATQVAMQLRETAAVETDAAPPRSFTPVPEASAASSAGETNSGRILLARVTPAVPAIAPQSAPVVASAAPVANVSADQALPDLAIVRNVLLVAAALCVVWQLVHTAK